MSLHMLISILNLSYSFCQHRCLYPQMIDCRTACQSRVEACLLRANDGDKVRECLK